MARSSSSTSSRVARCPGRRWSDGLHQAIEAKEGVAIRQENQTVASITFQNYFRLYNNLSGMTGTADTEAFEFQSIYGLEVVVIPTHRDMVRIDSPDLVYLTQKDKFEAIIEDITDCRERGQPVLVGTTSIETSELLSTLLNERKIKHEVLNAKQHEREATVVQQAGRPGAITIATNMAGRGTDIVLGGNLDAEIAAAGEGADVEADSRRMAATPYDRCWRPVDCILWVRNGMNHGASTTSYAAAPAARVTPGHRASTCRWKTR